MAFDLEVPLEAELTVDVTVDQAFDVRRTMLVADGAVEKDGELLVRQEGAR